MSENVEKKRENGYYWVRSGPPGEPFIVEVCDDRVVGGGTDDYWYLDCFEADYEFIEGPLRPSPLDLRLMLEVVAQARRVVESPDEFEGAAELAEALRKLDALEQTP